MHPSSLHGINFTIDVEQEAASLDFVEVFESLSSDDEKEVLFSVVEWFTAVLNQPIIMKE